MNNDNNGYLHVIQGLVAKAKQMAISTSTAYVRNPWHIKKWLYHTYPLISSQFDRGWIEAAIEIIYS